MEDALSFYSVGKDFGTTGTRCVSVGLLGGTMVPLDKGGRPVAVGPSHAFTYRKVRLPQSNAKASRRIVQEELTFGLPLPLHQCVWDCYMQPGPEAFAVVTQQARWQALSSRWGAVQGVDPEPLCYLRAALHMGIADGLVLDLGASHTTWVALVNGKIDWVRTMMRGGQQLTHRLSEETRISLQEAEDLKRRRGLDTAVVQAFVAEMLEEALLPRPLPYRRIFLCGGGSSMPGLRAYLHTQLGVEPEPFPMPPLLSPTEHVSCFGAALAGRLGQQMLRFQGTTTQQPMGEASLNQWMAVGGAALALWVAGTELRYQGLVRQQAQLRTQFRQNAGQMGVNLPAQLNTPGQAEKWLSEQQRFRQQVRSRSVGTVADAFARANQGLKEVGDCQLFSLSYDEGKIRLEGDAGSQVRAQQLRIKWGQIFPDLRAPVSKGAGDRFRFEMEGGLPKQ